MNDITIQGTVLRDPEMRYTPSGKALTKFAILVDGVDQPATCLAWEDLAERVAREFWYGLRVKLTGYVKTNTYTHHDEFTIQIIHEYETGEQQP
jgi:single-strand DNA-binding protein